MASFSTMEEAEERVREKVADGTWINAHSARGVTGTILVRVQRPMSPGAPDAGGWVEITDNSID